MIHKDSTLLPPLEYILELLIELYNRKELSLIYAIIALRLCKGEGIK